MKTILFPFFKFTFLGFILISCEVPQISLEDCFLPTDINQVNDEKFAHKASEKDSESIEDSVTNNTDHNTKNENIPPIACIKLEPELESQMQINATLDEFNEVQTQKMNNALERLKIVLNSQDFKQRILDHEYKGEKSFANNDGLTNLEIYEKIMLGSEELEPGDDSEVDIHITLYYANNGTVGYTYPSVNRIWVNNKFFSGYSLAKVAANVAHEWSHKLGFEHDFKRTVRRNYSVPYAVGKIVKELIEKMATPPIQEMPNQKSALISLN